MRSNLSRIHDRVLVSTGPILLKTILRDIYFARREIESLLAVKPDPWLAARMLDLKKILRARQPKCIVEFGSGMSTVLFALYCDRSNARLLSFEEDPKWATITKSAVKASGANSFEPTVATKVTEPDKVYFDASVPEDADFLFVDGPANTVHGQKVPCTDVHRALDRGLTPETIVVSGRAETARSIQLYAPDYLWSAGNSKQQQAMTKTKVRIGHHAVGLRKHTVQTE